ncbi:MAG: hypothetical protein ACPG32_15895 [Akkermansiaceae bacterium]
MAIKSQDGVKNILLSGYRATVIMEDGKSLEKEALTKAVVAKGLQVKSFEKTSVVVPAEAYMLAVSGTG